MKLDAVFKQKECVFALEIFPPKQASGFATLYRMLEQLQGVAADYISVTYSAGGAGVKEYTVQIAEYLKSKLQIEPLAHLTCLNSSAADVAAELQQMQAAGVENILALRGDRNPNLPAGRDFAHASDLIAAIRKEGDFYIAAACYPEGHPESANLTADLENVRRKLEAGAGHLVTQLFFDNGKFFRFLNLARKKGINCPIEAGVMPIVKKEQIERTIALSSASLPADFSKMVSRYSHNAEDFYRAGLDYAIRQIRDLIESGVDGIHLYAMNNADVARQVYEAVQDLL